MCTGQDRWTLPITGFDFLGFQIHKHPVVGHHDRKCPCCHRVRNDNSPFDGDWVSWSQHLQRYPMANLQVVTLLKWQRGRWAHCGLLFMNSDLMEVHHINAGALWGRRDSSAYNLALLHAHCNDEVHDAGCPCLP
ncbi:MAG: hypothetical protein D6791_00345 [Chloroflexi bacterium]|nr:MAG: hypothetical protein D6791_00345 [Chloroflexota bacterium]